ncbi:MAG: DNA methylase [Spirochaetes bacterium]|nr:MAG: DNA methylase [Spirochaetota bacterium]
MPKPPLRIQTTTFWDYPSQNYGKGTQGSQDYIGATPSYIIWNLLKRYTREGNLVIDPMCGSGTTLDVCGDTGRIGQGFDINPIRDDIERADARSLPVADGRADFVFVDPPYGDNIEYSDCPECIGRLSATSGDYFDAMEMVIHEMWRVLRPDRFMALYVCDYFNKKHGFVPIGFHLFEMMSRLFVPVDIVSVMRHNKSLKMGNFHKAAEEGNFYLRGFNYLFIMRKEKQRNASAGHQPQRKNHRNR